ncbi:mitochondrial ribosomal protein S6 [Megachile rotundata]|uniref:mitochondrial ribosomal protein S6 n=1 Tax=Megachile rotundata TaxID=143995 RepID=UPI000614DE56|nr:PREDICTED: probable 28S ribosomal protein S6, mitochondrial [Megachile rotundata]
MPTYEMPLLLRLGKKAEYANILKTVAETIFSVGGFIRTIENWGEKELPCKASSHGQVHRKAGHFFMSFDVPPASTFKILDECQRNLSIVRVKIYLRNEPPENVECTFGDEMLPPPYRPSVKKMLEQSEKEKNKKKKQFEYNSGLDYYPFLR